MDDLRSWNASIVISSIIRVTSLGIVIGTPGPDVAVSADSQAMIVTAGDLANLLTRTLDRVIVETNAVGYKRFDKTSFNDTTTQLILLTVTPGPDVPVLVDSKNMISSASNLNNLLEIVDIYWGSSRFNSFGEAKDSFIFLCGY